MSALRAKNIRVYLELKSVALLAIDTGMDDYEFKQICAAALAQAALEIKKGRVGAASQMIGRSRNVIARRAKLIENMHTKYGIDSEPVTADTSSQ